MTTKVSEYASLEPVSPSEFARFRDFLSGLTVRRIQVKDLEIPYSLSGKGENTVLTFAGGWGGIPLIWETIRSFQEEFQVLAVDTSLMDGPDLLSRATNQILGEIGTDQVVLLGQSYSGILAQLYFRRNQERVDELILVHTLFPRRERCRKWARALLALIPFPLFRLMVRRKVRKLSDTEKPVPPEIQERRCFAQALLGVLTGQSLTRARLTRMLDLAWAFNLEGEYTPQELRDWPGRVLLVASEDDDNGQDMVDLETIFPQAEAYRLPRGFGHTAPQIYHDDWVAAAREFLKGPGAKRAEKTQP